VKGGAGAGLLPKGKGKGAGRGIRPINVFTDGGSASKHGKVKTPKSVSPLSVLPQGFDKLPFSAAKKWLDDADLKNKAPGTVLAIIKKRLRVYCTKLQQHWSYCDYCMEATKGPSGKELRKKVNDDAGYAFTAKVITEAKKLAALLAALDSSHAICACPAEQWGTRVNGAVWAELQRTCARIPDVVMGDIDLGNGTTLSWEQCRLSLAKP
jgi:hypothetical protein